MCGEFSSSRVGTPVEEHFYRLDVLDPSQFGSGQEVAHHILLERASEKHEKQPLALGPIC